VGIAHASPSSAVVDMGQCSSLPLPVLIKSKVVKEALQVSPMLRVQVQSCVNQSKPASGFNLQWNYFTLIKWLFVRRATDLGKTSSINFLFDKLLKYEIFSLLVTTNADAFL